MKNWSKFLISFETKGDVSDLVKKCFEHSVILSQLEIRKIIARLEEWKETDALIFGTDNCIQDQSRTVVVVI